VKIAIENCMASMAYRPDIWEKLFEAIPSSSLGLEFDPSHLIFQLMDAVEVADRFGDRIFHTHMKDGQILWKRVSQYGMESGGVHLHRLPGFGDLNWAPVHFCTEKTSLRLRAQHRARGSVLRLCRGARSG
jgi:sugar phosphate isomerase/epimerase